MEEAGLVMNHLDASTARNCAGKYTEFALSFCEPRGLCPCPADADTVVIRTPDGHLRRLGAA